MDKKIFSDLVTPYLFSLSGSLKIHLLTCYLLVVSTDNICKQFGPRLGPTLFKQFGPRSGQT